MKTLNYHVFEHKFGKSLLAWSKSKVSHHFFDSRSPKKLLELHLKDQYKLVRRDSELPKNIENVKRQLSDYFSGKPTRFISKDICFENFSDFQKSVYKNLLAVQSGKTLSYQDLALLSNSPKAARAVGSCMARNPLPIIIPCHRVLPQNKKIGAYSSPSGPKMKIKLLNLEGIEL